MLALIENGCGEQLHMEYHAGMRAIRMELCVHSGMSERQRQKALVRACHALRELGADRVLFRHDFQYGRFFCEHGFAAADSRFLFEKVLCLFALKLKGEAAAIFARRLTPLTEKMLLILGARFRQLLVYMQQDGKRVCTALERRFGTAAFDRPPGERLMQAQAALFFCRPENVTRLPGKCVAAAADISDLRDVKGGIFVRSARIGYEGGLPSLPAGYDGAAIMSQALIRGTLSPDRLYVSSLRAESNCLTGAGKAYIIT